jgi:modulator of FtsH protease
MFNPRNNSPYGNNPYGNPYGGRNRNFGSAYQYQTVANGYEGTQSSGLMGKVMSLLAFSFIFAAIGAFVGTQIITGISYWIVILAGFVVLFALQVLIQKPGINLFLLYLFTFLEGLGLGPLVRYYTYSSVGTNLLAEAFLITAITCIGLGFYAWTTKRDFTRLGDYLFFGLILLIVASLVNLIFRSELFVLVICVAGIAIFAGYMLFYIQRAKYMQDTLPNAIGLTVSLFITILNLFLYILELLSILQGGRSRR